MIITNFRIASYLTLLILLSACSKIDVKNEFPKHGNKKKKIELEN